jgi:uncharacterized protein (DUF302 family)
MAQPEAQGIVRRKSKRSVEETVKSIKEILAAKGIQLFAEIDHSGEAEKVGMQMRPTKLLIFGNAKAGTPLMQAVPSTAIDLPLKVLVAEESDGQAWMSYNSGAYLQQRHNFPAEFLKTVSAVEAIVEAVAG